MKEDPGAFLSQVSLPEKFQTLMGRTNWEGIDFLTKLQYTLLPTYVRGLKELLLKRTILKELYLLSNTAWLETRWGFTTFATSLILQPRNLKDHSIYLFRGMTGVAMLKLFRSKFNEFNIHHECLYLTKIL